MRKYYIDNLRTLCILLLFPYHTFMVYNTFESFYVHGPKIQPLSDFVYICWPFFMPLMFALAGISSRYALQRRSAREYVKERFLRLFIPLVFGILLVIPAQTYFAERFHNGYTGGYFEHYVLFFTKATDLTGYNGGFTPAQLWFILYLFIISLLALPVMLWYNKRDKVMNGSSLTLPKLLPLFVFPLLGALIPIVDGRSIGEYFAWFMLGYFALSPEEVLQRLEKYRWPLTAFAAILLAGFYYSYILNGREYWFLVDILQRAAGWVSILAFLGLGRRYLNFTSKAATYFAGASFPVYIFHQTWLVIAAYYTLQLTDIVALQIPTIIAVSFTLSILTYELTKRLSVTRFMFGIKKPAPQKEAACNSGKK
ncbi:acyltransferase family protein [Acetanaerobacterium elongatum]|uniref:Peptidoglycan/LPS O-acetylase OafA/YrhL, contains acyltransferase and SGNH-hydrolase domains n=1 Tax=Acetanaerobacterium elongatum TaxID=258515 RepID=A0A1H0EQX1_9FIRM|nr:acyltransferase family protein [Acetanaerobacterium elongatum]SDN84736.1 Peptidoglycan/LPS O-acetylase OafA/YrhL, contains acyltransferase and SGNH-hydrolase domains [Acetanaerobacterium elongatum]